MSSFSYTRICCYYCRTGWHTINDMYSLFFHFVLVSIIIIIAIFSMSRVRFYRNITISIRIWTTMIMIVYEIPAPWSMTCRSHSAHSVRRRKILHFAQLLINFTNVEKNCYQYFKSRVDLANPQNLPPAISSIAASPKCASSTTLLPYY